MNAEVKSIASTIEEQNKTAQEKQDMISDLNAEAQTLHSTIEKQRLDIERQKRAITSQGKRNASISLENEDLLQKLEKSNAEAADLRAAKTAAEERSTAARTPASPAVRTSMFHTSTSTTLTESYRQSCCAREREGQGRMDGGLVDALLSSGDMFGCYRVPEKDEVRLATKFLGST